jgi:hypothetical protein
MFETSSANLIGGFVFGSIGFVAFIYGKRMNLWKIMLCGLALMIFPYFIADTVILYVIGAFETAALLFLREQRDILEAVNGLRQLAQVRETDS